MCNEARNESKSVGIIVPVYNVEPYLEDCIHSIKQQIDKKIEVIYVDDGSVDLGEKLCDECAIEDPRVVVIHKKNGGLSDARNFGLGIVTSDFITFVDSDDYISDDYVQELRKLQLMNNADIVVSNYLSFADGENSLNYNGEPYIETLTGIQAIERLVDDDCGPFIVAWGKLYKRELFINQLFEYGRIYEDEFIVHRIFYKSGIVVHTTQPLYFYRQVGSSITGRPLSLKKLDYLDALKDRVNFFAEQRENGLNCKFQKWYLYRARDFYKIYKESSLSLPQKEYAEKKMQADYRECLKNIGRNTLVPLKEKMWMYLFLISPEMYYLLRRV